MATKQIIYWVTSNLTPQKVKRTVINIQKQGGKRGRKASRDLTYFHQMLRKISKRFKTSYDLGLEAKPPSTGGGGNSGGKGGK